MTSIKPLYIRGFIRNVDPTLSSLIRLRTPRLGVCLGVRWQSENGAYPQMPLSDAKIRALHSTDKPCKVANFDRLVLLVKVTGAKSWRFRIGC